MGKKLITIKNYTEYVCENKFFATNDIIVTSAVKDELRSRGIEIVYVKCGCGIEGRKKQDKSSEENRNAEKEIVAILVKEYGITDTETIKNIILRMKEELKGE